MKKWQKIMITLIAIIGFLVIIWLLFKHTGLLERCKTVDELQEYILSKGAAAILAYIAFGIMLLMFLPNWVIWSTGYACFGLWAILWAYIISIIAACLFFVIGRLAGRKNIDWIFGKDSVEKQLKKIDGKDFKALTICFLLPLTPDNLLSVCAGLTNMKIGKFMAMVAIVRIITVPLNILAAAGIINIWR